jgi:hypothetical protein
MMASGVRDFNAHPMTRLYLVACRHAVTLYSIHGGQLQHGRGCIDLDQKLIVIDSYEELRARPGFAPSLAFHPKSDRHFGAVVAPYRFRELIACGIDSCHTPHQNGYLITTSDGRETGIGSHCGRKHFGIQFTREKKRVDEAVQRKRRIDTVMRAVALIPEYLVTVKQLKHDYQELTDMKRRFMSAVGLRMMDELKRRAGRRAEWIMQAEPMTKAEARAHFATNNRKQSDSKEWPTKEVPVAKLDGLDFIGARFTDMLVTNLINPLERFAQTKPGDAEKMGPRELYNEAKWLGAVPNDIAKAKVVISAGRAFFVVNNLMKLVHLDADMDALKPMLKDLREAELSQG